MSDERNRAGHAGMLVEGVALMVNVQQLAPKREMFALLARGSYVLQELGVLLQRTSCVVWQVSLMAAMWGKLAMAFLFAYTAIKRGGLLLGGSSGKPLR